MLEPLSKILGKIFKAIYEYLVSMGNEPAQVSYYAIALLLMAVIYKLITIPLTIQSLKQTRKTAELQPQLDELKKKYGYDQEIYTKKVQEFQKEHNLAGAGCSGCLLMILQLVIVIALFQVIKNPAMYLFDDPKKIDEIAKNFFWVKDLSLVDPTGFVLALVNSLSQLLVTYLGQSQNASAAPGMQSQQSMMYIMPIAFFFIFMKMPAGLLLYWVAGNIIEIVVKLIGNSVNANKLSVDEVK